MCLVLLSGCIDNNSKTPEIIDMEEDDVIAYNVIYELTYNPIYEDSDRFSYLILSRDNTFFMSVNSCDGLDSIKGEFFIDGNNLYIVPENYSCDLNDLDEECEVEGIRFIIENYNKLIITIGLRCIAEDSIFEIEK